MRRRHNSFLQHSTGYSNISLPHSKQFHNNQSSLKTDSGLCLFAVVSHTMHSKSWKNNVFMMSFRRYVIWFCWYTSIFSEHSAHTPCWYYALKNLIGCFLASSLLIIKHNNMVRPSEGYRATIANCLIEPWQESNGFCHMWLSQGRRLQTQGRKFHRAGTEKCYCTVVGANNSRTDLLLPLFIKETPKACVSGHIEHNSYLLISVISRYAIFCHVILKDLSFLCSYIVRLDLWQNSYCQNI